MNACLPLLLSQGHLLLEIEDKTYLLDTGSPVSLGDPFSFTLAGEPFCLEPSPEPDPIQRNKKELEKLVGRPFHALLGLDLLARFLLVLDLKNKLALFNPKEPPAYSLCLPFSYPMGRGISIPLSIGASTFQALVDTGAPLSYIAPQYVQTLSPVGKAEDFSPLLGSFRTDVYEVACYLGTQPMPLRAGVFTPSLEVIAHLKQIGAILGPSFFEGKRLIFDFKAGFLRF